MGPGETCDKCCRHGVVAEYLPCDLCAETVQEGDTLLLLGDHYYTHVVTDPVLWQAPEMDATCVMWSRGKRVIWTRFHRG